MKTTSLTAILAAGALCLSTGAWAKIKIPALPGHTGGPGTTTPQYIQDLEAASAPLRTLDQDARTLYSDQAALIVRIDKIKDFLRTSADRLGLISTLDADLRALEASIAAIDAAATTAEAITQARPKAQKIKETLAPLKANVTAARQRVDAIKAKTEPIRVKLDSAADKAEAVSKALWAINQGAIGNMRFPIAIAAGCLKKLPADKQACAGRNLDNTAAKVDEVVREYDRVVRQLLANPQPWLPSMAFFDPFSADLNELDSLRLEIERIARSLKGLAGQLGKVNAVLGQEFSFSFPYPNPTLTNPLRMSAYDVSISFKTILDGAKAIEDKIEDKVGGFLWGVLNDLGVGKYVRQLQKEADNAVNSALSALNLDIDVSMPSLAVLEKLETAELILSADLDALKFPEIDTQLPSYGFPDVPAGVNFGSIDASVSFFSPAGYDWRTPNLCEGATYGCK